MPKEYSDQTQIEKQIGELTTQVAVLTNSSQNVERKVDNIDRALRSDFVSKDKYDALDEKVNFIGKVMYGIGAIVVTIIIYAIAGLLKH